MQHSGDGTTCAADRALLDVTGGAAFVSDETSIPFTSISSAVTARGGG